MTPWVLASLVLGLLVLAIVLSLALLTLIATLRVMTHLALEDEPESGSGPPRATTKERQH